MRAVGRDQTARELVARIGVGPEVAGIEIHLEQAELGPASTNVAPYERTKDRGDHLAAVERPELSDTRRVLEETRPDLTETVKAEQMTLCGRSSSLYRRRDERRSA
jgi:hypothetical protein